jgi:hypothetical protein
MFEPRKRLRVAGVLLDEILRALTLKILCAVVQVKNSTSCERAADQVTLFFPKMGNLILMAFQSKKSKQPDHE